MNLLLKQGDLIPQILSTNISAFEWNPICVFITSRSKVMTQNRSHHIYINASNMGVRCTFVQRDLKRVQRDFYECSEKVQRDFSDVNRHVSDMCSEIYYFIRICNIEINSHFQRFNSIIKLQNIEKWLSFWAY